jgi:hypothetical protein
MTKVFIICFIGKYVNIIVTISRILSTFNFSNISHYSMLFFLQLIFWIFTFLLMSSSSKYILIYFHIKCQPMICVYSLVHKNLLNTMSKSSLLYLAMSSWLSLMLAHHYLCETIQLFFLKSQILPLIHQWCLTDRHWLNSCSDSICCAIGHNDFYPCSCYPSFWIFS